MRKKRVLYIIASSEMGGAENFIYTFLKSLNNSKYEKYVACPSGGYYSKKFESTAKKTLFISPKQSFVSPAIISDVARFIRDNNIDLTHTMLYTSDFCGIFARLLSGRSRIVNTVNGLNFLVFKKGSLWLKKRAASLVYRVIYGFSNTLVAVSESVRQDLINRRGVRVRPEKIKTVLAAGVNDSYDNFTEEDVAHLRKLYCQKGATCVSAIGTLNKVKGYDIMLEAFSISLKKNPGIVLLIAGDGPERERLIKKTESLGLAGRVHFLGGLEERIKNALLHLTDILIMSSETEGCPTVLFEAMYFRKPVIAPAVGGIPEIIKDGETGILTATRNPLEMSRAVLGLARDGEKRRKMGESARNLFERRFTQRHMLDAYEGIYDELLKDVK